MKSKMVDESSQISFNPKTSSFKQIYSLKYPEIFSNIGNLNNNNSRNIINSKLFTVNSQNLSHTDIQSNLSNECIFEKTHLINDTYKSNSSNNILSDEKPKTIFIEDNILNLYNIDNESISHNLKINDLLNKTRRFFNSHGLFLDNRKKIDILDKNFNYKNIKISKINFQKSKSSIQNLNNGKKKFFDIKKFLINDNYKKKLIARSQNKLISNINSNNPNFLLTNSTFGNIKKEKKFGVLLPSIPRLLKQNNEIKYYHSNEDKFDNEPNFKNNNKKYKKGFINIAELQDVYYLKYKFNNRLYNNYNKYNKRFCGINSFDENRNKRKINGQINKIFDNVINKYK